MKKTYDYQKKVAALLIEGKNVILQAPTGAGKTYAAMLPFLNSLEFGRNFPKKCIYSVPMCVLAKQFVSDYQSAIKKAGRSDTISVSIQTGDQQTDRKLESNLIFATIDQTLSSFLISPYSLSKRQANVNAGAVVSSYLVFDEFHLFDPNSTLPTTLHMLKMLKGVTPFLLMTATFSQTMLDELAIELDAVVVGTSDSEKAEFVSLQSQDKKRFYHTVDDVMTAETILEKHKGRTLIICNQVARARRIYEHIKAQANFKIEVLLLHSHFITEDRNQIEDRIRSVFGKDNRHSADDTIVISTQAIEVGVDMTSTVLHTELAPANSIIQRAGRCARYQGDEGHVYIYRRAINKDGEEIDLCDNPLPYEDRDAVFPKTWVAFDARCDEQFSYDDEQAVLNDAHHEQDQRIINELRGQSVNHRHAIYASMRGQEDARNLIRNIIAQSVTVHDDPLEVAKNPFAYPSFSLHPGTLQKQIQQWLESPAYQNVHQISMIRLNENEYEAQANDERYRVEPVLDASQAWMSPLLVVHPNLATYDKQLGFIPDNGGDWIAVTDEKATRADGRSGYSYRLETYEEHIALVYEQFERYWLRSRWVANRLEQHFEWQTGSIEKAARLAVLLHDVGKLSDGWQGWVRDYQRKLADSANDPSLLTQAGQAYAHTDYDFANPLHSDAQKSMRKRPWHAVEGAYAVWDILLNELDDNEALVKATYTAIARHHTSQSSEHQTYQLEVAARHHIEKTFEGRLSLPDLSALYGVDETVDKFDSDASELFFDEKDKASLLAYMLLVRVLRRADSKGTQLGSF
ncbi:MAG: CRISPR-associated helicase Cas3' [Phototrophicaceae bacterium]